MLAALAILAVIVGTGLAAHDVSNYANAKPTPIVQQLGEAECYDIDGDGWVNYACECVTPRYTEAFPEK